MTSLVNRRGPRARFIVCFIEARARAELRWRKKNGVTRGKTSVIGIRRRRWQSSNLFEIVKILLLHRIRLRPFNRARC